MVRDAVWDSVVESCEKVYRSGEYTLDGVDVSYDLTIKTSGMLCVGCLERRLGRQLTHRDFIDYPINLDPECQRSLRLQMRMMR
jgi:hypothetical protein